jgi:hypothetical protein
MSAMLLALGLILPGCEQTPEAKKAPVPQTTNKADAVKPDEPAAKPEPPVKKADEPAAKSETPAQKPLELAVKPADQTNAAPAAKTTDGEPPAAPKVSTFAPAEDLASQAADYIDAIEKAVASEDDYTDAKEELARNSNTLIVIALALGLHDQQSPYKATAPAVVKAAQAVAAATDYAAAQKAVADLKTAVDGKGAAGDELKWTKVASLEQLMKQVPLVNTKLKRNVRGPRLRAKAKETAGYSAVIAAIAQGSLANTQEAKTPEQVAQWYAFSSELRETAGAVNAAIHGGDEAATDAAMTRLAKSCDDCHAVFHKAAVAK